MGRHALLMLANDITERRQSRAALAESEERFRMMADTAPVMIWVADTDRCFSFFNKPWLEFTGRTTEQEAGSGWIEGIHPEDRENYLRVYAEAFDRRESFNLEHRRSEERRVGKGWK